MQRIVERRGDPIRNQLLCFPNLPILVLVPDGQHGVDLIAGAHVPELYYCSDGRCSDDGGREERSKRVDQFKRNNNLRKAGDFQRRF
jgi:hypothetical protein